MTQTTAKIAEELPEGVENVDWDKLSEEDAAAWGRQLGVHRDAVIEHQFAVKMRNHSVLLLLLSAINAILLVTIVPSSVGVALGMIAGLAVFPVFNAFDAAALKRRCKDTRLLLEAACAALPQRVAAPE